MTLFEAAGMGWGGGGDDIIYKDIVLGLEIDLSGLLDQEWISNITMEKKLQKYCYKSSLEQRSE